MKRCIGILIILLATGLLMANQPILVYQDAGIKELRGVFAMSNGRVWAVGTDGAVRKSTNNGDTWQTVTISGATDYHLNSVFFYRPDTGVIVGEKKADPDRFKGIIYRTTNGGSSWSIVQNCLYEKYIPFKDVVFQIREGGNPRLGYIAAGEGWVYQTTNGGQTWFREPVDSTKKHCFHSVAFDLFNTNTIYAVGDAGAATGIVAYNSGSGWVVEYPHSNLGLNFFGVSLRDASRPNIAASKGYDDVLLIPTNLQKIIPNPATQSALIQFNLAQESYVRIDMYDVVGRMVKNLVADDYSRGKHTLKFDLKSNSG
ncbi:MAG: hypothetical protein N2748_05750, partial [candidate division WOR-3 bacterium]|nr:hypothetical protein [candidate division WOR-3 bacterium]